MHRIMLFLEHQIYGIHNLFIEPIKLIPDTFGISACHIVFIQFSEINTNIMISVLRIYS